MRGGSTANNIGGGLFALLTLLFGGGLLFYYGSGTGGPMLLAVAMLPLALALLNLDAARQGLLYPALTHPWQLALALLGTTLALGAALYLLRAFDAIRIERAGFWSGADLLAGGVVVALVLEYCWRRYRALFVINLLLLLYAVYGAWLPGALQHPGISWTRALSAASLEMSTGVFDRLAQLGLTLIGAFILVLSTLRAFGCIDAILKASGRLATRSPQWLPQAAVAGSFAVASVSGSGAANAATTGSATIPALIRAGFPRVQAAAVETAASLGGQLMPPLMGIAAFMMAELMGVSYFDVVARGFVPALLFFLGVSAGVYLLARRHRAGLQAPARQALDRFDLLRLLAWLLSIAALVWLMGVQREPAMRAAGQVFLGLLPVLLALQLWQARGNWHRTLAPLPELLRHFAITTSELTVLLASLGILTALFTITGVPTQVGVLVMEMAQVHLVLMVLVAFAFGYLVGMGLPAAPTYIILAVVIAPFMIRAGIEPWVVHFFAFFVAVFGELSPPTSVTAAVTARIAEAPFTRTMVAAMGLCLPLLVLTAAVFTRPALVLEPGLPQLGAAVLTGIGILGLTLALQGQLHRARMTDRGLRLLLAALSLGAILHPADTLAGACALASVALAGACLLRHRAGSG